MDLQEALRKRNPIAVTWHDSTRLVSHIYVTRDGNRLVWAEKDWMINDHSHPVHLVEGAINGDGPWVAGDAKFFDLHEDAEDQGKLWMNWVAMVGAERANGHDYEKAVQILSKEF